MATAAADLVDKEGDLPDSQGGGYTAEDVGQARGLEGFAEPVQLESLCMNCHDNGQTTMLLTKIPHFREVLLASFECPHCNFKNNEVQFAGAFGETGVRYTLKVPAGDAELLSQQVVKAETATVTVPELDFEIPASTQKGSITNVEGLLQDAAQNLRMLQEERRRVDPDTAAALDAFLARLDACSSAETPFTLIVDDPAGNSFVEAPEGEGGAQLLRVSRYQRSREQQEAIGLLSAEEAAAMSAHADGGDIVDASEVSASDPHHGAAPVGAAAAQQSVAHARGEAAAAIISRYTSPEDVYELPGQCYACGASCSTRMTTTTIPYFKEVIIMSNSCDVCGYRNAELKPGGGFSDRGTITSLQVTEPADLRRDAIKAESAEVSIPELDMQLGAGTLGGLVTTVEGLLANSRAQLESIVSFKIGDSALQVHKDTWGDFFARLEDCTELRTPWTLVLKDPLANSFISSVTEDPAQDPRLRVEEYERSAEEDETYGIDHLKQEDAKEASKLAQLSAEDSQEGPAAGEEVNTS